MELGATVCTLTSPLQICIAKQIFDGNNKINNSYNNNNNICTTTINNNKNSTGNMKTITSTQKLPI